MTRALRKELGGVPYGETEPVVPISDLRAYYLRFLIALRPPHSINIFSDFQAGNVPDRMGNGFGVTLSTGTANLVSTEGPANGANNSITALAGNTATSVVWAASNIPVINTMCAVSRATVDYTTGPQRVLTGYYSASGAGQRSWDGVYGHFNGKRGVLHQTPEWFTQNINSEGEFKDWLVMCWTSGGTVPTLSLIHI